MSDATEKIEFTYTFTDDEGFERKVISKIAKDSVTASEVCEEFLSFMNAAGYSEQCIWDYFKE